MKSFVIACVGLASAAVSALSPLSSLNLSTLREHLLQQNYTIPNIPYENRFNATINQLQGWGFNQVGVEFGMMSSQFNMQQSYIELNYNYRNYSSATLVDLDNQTVTGWENDGPCQRRNISENITIGGIVDYLKYNTTYEGLQRVSWDGGRNFYHVISVNNQSFMYYDRYNNDVKYVY